MITILSEFTTEIVRYVEPVKWAVRPKGCWTSEPWDQWAVGIGRSCRAGINLDFSISIPIPIQSPLKSSIPIPIPLLMTRSIPILTTDFYKFILTMLLLVTTHSYLTTQHSTLSLLLSCNPSNLPLSVCLHTTLCHL